VLLAALLREEQPLHLHPLFRKPEEQEQICGRIPGTKSVRVVELKSPQTMTVARGRCTFEPKPVANDAGTKPRIAI
jgi:hypothetical protein